jgi:hypothetical protein
MTSIGQDNKAAQAQYSQDMMSAALRRTTPKKPQTEELNTMFKKGLITQNEFNSKRAEILKNM